MSLYKELQVLLDGTRDRQANLVERLARLQTDLEECDRNIAALEVVIRMTLQAEGKAAGFGLMYTNGTHSAPVEPPPPPDLTELDEAILLCVQEHPGCTVDKVVQVTNGLGFALGGQALSPRLQRLCRIGRLQAGERNDRGRLTYHAREAAVIE